MKRIGLVIGLAVLALACSETVGGMMQDAGTMLADAGEMMRDAGDADASTMPDGSTGSGGGSGTAGTGGGPMAQTFPLDCSGGGFVLTDVDQKELGKVIIRQRFPDSWGVTDPPQMVDYQTHAIWSIGGKVLVQCNGGVTEASIEVLP
jgi:hypothetical protein